jgi:hypothetical protein
MPPAHFLEAGKMPVLLLKKKAPRRLYGIHTFIDGTVYSSLSLVFEGEATKLSAERAKPSVVRE